MDLFEMDLGAAPGTPPTVAPIIGWDAVTDVAMLEEQQRAEDVRPPLGRVVARRNLCPVLEDILVRIGVLASPLPYHEVDSVDGVPPSMLPRGVIGFIGSDSVNDLRQYRFIGPDGVIATMPFFPTSSVTLAVEALSLRRNLNGSLVRLFLGTSEVDYDKSFEENSIAPGDLVSFVVAPPRPAALMLQCRSLFFPDRVQALTQTTQLVGDFLGHILSRTEIGDRGFFRLTHLDETLPLNVPIRCTSISDEAMEVCGCHRSFLSYPVVLWLHHGPSQVRVHFESSIMDAPVMEFSLLAPLTTVKSELLRVTGAIENGLYFMVEGAVICDEALTLYDLDLHKRIPAVIRVVRMPLTSGMKLDFGEAGLGRPVSWDQPRINLTGRYIRNHHCSMPSRIKTSPLPPQTIALTDTAPTPPPPAPQTHKPRKTAAGSR